MAGALTPGAGLAGLTTRSRLMARLGAEGSDGAGNADAAGLAGYPQVTLARCMRLPNDDRRALKRSGLVIAAVAMLARRVSGLPSPIIRPGAARCG